MVAEGFCILKGYEFMNNLVSMSMQLLVELLIELLYLITGPLGMAGHQQHRECCCTSSTSLATL